MPRTAAVRSTALGSTHDGPVDFFYTSDVVRLIDAVTRRLTTDTVRKLNAKVQIDGVAPHRVARNWLRRWRMIE